MVVPTPINSHAPNAKRDWGTSSPHLDLGTLNAACFTLGQDLNFQFQHAPVAD